MKKIKIRHNGGSTLADHTTPFEKRFASFLNSLNTPERLTVSDIKDIIWNAQDHNLMTRLTYIIAEENPKVGLREILNIFNEAWNNFPHQQLNGLAPREMILRLSKDKSFTAESRRSFFSIFSGRFPKKVRIRRVGKNEWQCEYPAALQEMRECILGMENARQEKAGSEAESARTVEEIMDPIRLATANELLEQEPFLFEAAIICAKAAFENNKSKSSRQFLESAIERARALFPPEFKFGKDILPWGFIDNRPILSLFAEYATFVESADGPLAAIRHYEELLALNPSDNQGMRGLLATAYLKTNHLEELLKLDAKYPNDMTAELTIGALLALYKLGRLDAAQQRVLRMRKHWTHVFREILKTEHFQPELLPGRVVVGGEDEAWFYWKDQGTFWMAAPGAREFIRKHSGV